MTQRRKESIFSFASLCLCGRVFGLCFVLLTEVATAQTVYFPSNHWVYEYLDRMETKGVLPVVLAGTRPMTRWEIARHIASITDYYSKGGTLSRAEIQQLAFLHDEFREELERLQVKSIAGPSELSKIICQSWIDPWLPNAIYANGRNFLSVSEGPLRAFWDPIFLRRRMYAEADTLSQQERVFEDTNGFSLWGTVGEHLGFVADVRDSKEWGTRKYPEAFNVTAEGLGFVNGYGDHIYHDETVASLVYQWKYLTLQFGKDSNSWGPGRHGQLALSDHATSYDLLKFQVTTQRVKFTSMLAFLRQYPPLMVNGEQRDKALAAHRLEFSPIRWLDLGFHETVIYSGRKIEPAYLNPVMFYRSAEHYLGDRDNATMGADFELKLVPRTKLYGELFIDDITTGKLGTSYFGNKYAWLAGLYHVELFGLPNLDFRLEYARVRPFTYTHTEEYNTYRQFITNLGHWIGPNADDLFLDCSYQYSRPLKFDSFFEMHRHGANPPGYNYGGSIFAPHFVFRDPLYVNFLEGVLEKTTSFGANARYELVRNGFVRLSYRYDHGESEWVHEGNGPYPGDRSEVVFSFSLNY
jgi:hypothetical protein